MSSTVRWHPGASRDLIEAIKYYQACEESLDARFLAHVDAAASLATSNPGLNRCFDGSFRKVKVEHFPYALVYRQRDEAIEFLAVAHYSREPGYWKGRAAT